MHDANSKGTKKDAEESKAPSFLALTLSFPGGSSVAREDIHVCICN